jgi:group I intron endonuclease
VKLAVSGVYRIVCAVSGAVYIGSSVNMPKRFSIHIFHLKRGTHPNLRLQRAWLKYGEGAFRFDVLELVSPDKTSLLRAEQCHLDAAFATEDCMNVLPTAGSALGVKRSPEHRAAISAANKGRKMNEEQKARLSKAKKGRKLAPELLQKMLDGMRRFRAEHPSPYANFRRGANHPRLGKKHTDETRKVMSAGQRNMSDANRARIQIGRWGLDLEL